ncbi:MAG: hypothetical protein V4486_02565 [Patescibacteria group bacterium]
MKIKLKLKSTKRGFVLLFAITLASMLLAIALGVSSIALKELNFSTSARDSNEALFAADTGVECALFNDKTAQNKFPLAGPASAINCTSITPTYAVSGTPGSGNGVGSYNFIITSLGEANKSCALVNVTKTEIGTSSVVSTVVTARGYYPDSTANCNSSSGNRIQRELDVRYGTRRNLALGKPVTQLLPDPNVVPPTYPASNLTDGVSDATHQAYPNSTSFTYEVDLGSSVSVSQIRFTLCPAGAQAGDNGCYGFNNGDGTPYINSWQIYGDGGLLAQSSASPNGVPNTANLVISPGTTMRKIKISAQSTANSIGVYELEAY